MIFKLILFLSLSHLSSQLSIEGPVHLKFNFVTYEKLSNELTEISGAIII